MDVFGFSRLKSQMSLFDTLVPYSSYYKEGYIECQCETGKKLSSPLYAGQKGGVLFLYEKE